MMDLCVVNSSLLYRALKPEATIPLANFKLDVARGLIVRKVAVERAIPHQHGDSKILSAKNVNVDARYDNVEHFPGRKT